MFDKGIKFTASILINVFLGQKQKTKIRKIKVQESKAARPSTVDRTKDSFITFEEQTNRDSGTCTLVNRTESPGSISRKPFSTTACRQDLPSTSDKYEETFNMFGQKDELAETYYGDLVITDLANTDEPFVHD